MNIKASIKRIAEKYIGKIIILLGLDVFHQALSVRGFENGPTFKESGEEYLVRDILPEFIKEAQPIFFDVGANDGAYSEMFRSVFTEGHIYSFEPNPEVFNELHKKSEYLHLNLNLFQLALSDHDGKFPLYYSKNVTVHDYRKLATGIKEVYPYFYGDSTSVEISATAQTIDSFCAEHALNHIDFMKIDTEGNEFNVLKGAKKILSSQNISAIQFEFNEMNILNRIFLKDFFDLLGGFVFFRLKEGKLLRLTERSKYDEIFTFQNIVAIRKGIVDEIKKKKNIFS
jgi:FkbM family methyltransferase